MENFQEASGEVIEKQCVMNSDEKNPIEGSNENVVVVEKKKAGTLSRFFSFKNLNEYNDEAMASEQPDVMQKKSKTNTLMRYLNKKQQPAQNDVEKPEVLDKLEESHGNRASLFKRALGVPWITRKVSQMNLNRPKAEPEETGNKMTTEEIHEILIAN